MNKRTLGIKTLSTEVFHAEDIDISYLWVMTEFAAVSLRNSKQFVQTDKTYQTYF